MRVRFIQIFLFFIAPFGLKSQSKGNCDSSYQFQMYFADGNNSMRALDLEVANDSTVFLVGYHGSGSNQDGFVSSININGKVNWAVIEGGDEEDGLYCITHDVSGSIYVGGYTWSATSGRAAVMAKYLPNGSLAWRKIYGFGREYIYRVNVSANRKYVYFTGLSLDQSYGSEDFTIYKLDTNGIMQWAKQCGDPDLNRNHNLLESNDGSELYVIGMGGDAYPVFRANIVKLDSSGNLLWTKKYQMPTDYQVSFHDIKPWGNDLILYGYLGLNGGGSTSLTRESLLVRITRNGTVKWAKKYSLNTTIPWQMQIIDNNIVVGGGNSNNGGDGFLMLTDSNGNVLNAKHVGNGDYEFVFGLRTTAKKEIYFAGHKQGSGSTALLGKAGCRLSVPCEVNEAFPKVENITLYVNDVAWQIKDFNRPVNFNYIMMPFKPIITAICDNKKAQKNPCDGDTFKGISTNCNCPVYIPNAFTPGRSTNLNDKLQIEFSCSYNSAVVRIYNRWGEKVFESADSTTQWDGYYQGKPVPAGAYYCTVSIEGLYRGVIQEIIKSGLVYVLE